MGEDTGSETRGGMGRGDLSSWRDGDLYVFVEKAGAGLAKTRDWEYLCELESAWVAERVGSVPMNVIFRLLLWMGKRMVMG